MKTRYLILAVTSRCNLRCSYCYLGAGGHRDMPDRILERALDLVAAGSGPRHVQITGGEPTLVPEKIRRIGQRCRQMACPPSVAIQTNATLLTEELVGILRSFRIRVGVSLDGTPEIQERLRGGADQTLRGLALLDSRGIPFRVTTVVSAENVLFLDRLALMLAGYAHCRGIGLDLLVAKGRAKEGGIRPPPPAALRQGVARLAAVLDMVNQGRRVPLALRELDLLRDKRRRHNKQQPFCHAAVGQSLAVTPQGELYPCGQTMYDPFFSLGTLDAPRPAAGKPLTAIRLSSADCGACAIASRCPGDCPSRGHYSPAARPLACELYRALAGSAAG